MQIPKAPVTKSNDDLHRSLTDLIGFTRTMFQGGTKCRAMSADEMNGITDVQQVGSHIYNTTDNFPYSSYLDSNVLKWRKLT